MNRWGKEMDREEERRRKQVGNGDQRWIEEEKRRGMEMRGERSREERREKKS